MAIRKSDKADAYALSSTETRAMAYHLAALLRDLDECAIVDLDADILNLVEMSLQFENEAKACPI